MTVKAYILIEVRVGATKEVVDAVNGLAGVVSIDSVTGPYDAIAVVEGETLDDIGDLVTTKLHNVRGISRTVTCLVVARP